MRLGLGLGVNRGRKASGSLAETVIANLESQAASDGYTAFSGATKDASLVLVQSVVDAGVWSKLDLFYVFATNGDSDFAKYNWINPSGAFNMTEVGAGALTFTSNEGFTGDGTNYLDAGFNPQIGDGNYYLLNNASAGYYCRTAGNDLNIMGTSRLIAGANAGNFYYRINSSLPSAVAVAGDVQGFMVANRDASNSDDLYKDGSIVSVGANASTIATNAFLILRRSGAGQSTKQVSIAFAGGSLTPTEHSDFYNAVQTYMTTLGKAV